MRKGRNNVPPTTKIFPPKSENENVFTDSKTNKPYSSENEVFGSVKQTSAKETSLSTEELQSEIQTYYVLQKSDPNQHTRIIRGNFHQGDQRFDRLSGGKQSLTVSIVALSFFKINDNPATWKSADIDNILILGDVLYHASYKKMKREGTTPQAEYLLISEIYPFTKIGREYYRFDRIDENEDEKDIFNMTNLIRSLNNFFIEKKNQYGIFTCKVYSFAIMRKSNSVCLFNSHPTSYAGDPMDAEDIDSAACVMEVFTINCLANHLLNSCKMERNENLECYSLMKVFIEKKVFGKDLLRQKVSRDLCVTKKNIGGAAPKNLSGCLEEEEQHINGETELTTQKNNHSNKSNTDSVNRIRNNTTSINTGYEFNNDQIVTAVMIGCGMLNLGNSCFFNACLQAFFHIPTINIYLQKIKTKKCTCVSCNIITVFKETHTHINQPQLCYNPSNLYKVMQKRNMDLLNYKQQDAHEFWIRLMEAMENKENCSIILDQLFWHEVITVVQCGHCHKNFQTERKSSGHLIDFRGRLTIQEAVDDYFNTDIIETYLCESCKFVTENRTTKKYSLKNAPNILCLALNRFENRVKKIVQNLNINKQLALFSSNKNVNYKLVSIINHYGTDILSGHYTSVAVVSSQFYEFDDSNVNNINAIMGKNAYILIYELSEEVHSEERRLQNEQGLLEKPDSDSYNQIGNQLDDNTIPINADNEFDNDRITEIHGKITPNNSNFDEFMEIDDDGFDESTVTEATPKILIEDTYYPELDESADIQYDSGEQLLDEPDQNANIQFDNEEHLLDEPDQNADIRFDNELPFEPYHSTYIQFDNREQLLEERNTVSGRRIVDIDFLFEQMQYLNQHSDECHSHMVFTKETRLGFRSIFHFECSECGIFHKIRSVCNNINMNINKAATLGITSIGSGFYHLEEFCSHLNIPCMSSSTFETANKVLQEYWWKLGRHFSEEALKEEIEHARATGSVDSAGNALITVICDGSWGKRSYGRGFSSLSGCAALIGLYTKKVLYYDVKNKYCHTCTLSYAKFCPPNEHKCNINYYGPSSSMETEIIVEGFQFCEKFGARFNKMISDGDASAFKEIRELSIYQNPDLAVEKLECLNHLYKNAGKKLTALCTQTKYKLTYRKLLKLSIGDDLCKGIKCATKHWRESTLDYVEKLENLEHDCLNIAYHYFGNHDNCNKYFCQKTTSKESNATIDLLKLGGIFHEILNYCNIYFASNVRSLIEDYTTNAAEELNNVIAKYLGGKRINYSLAGSYGGRVSAAIVQYNSKGHAGSEYHKHYSVDTYRNCLKIENSRNNHYAKNEAARENKPRKITTVDKTTKGYKNPQTPDMSDHAFEVAKNIVLDKLRTNQLNRQTILENTYGQKLNWNWIESRKKIINCSYFGRIINARSPKTYSTLLHEMLYSESEFGNTAELKHQRLYETEALKMFSLVHTKHRLLKTGLYIDEELSFLAASPLRLYGPDAIVNVECPVKVFRKTLEEAMSKKYQKWLPYFKKKDGEIIINVKSNWYAEAQGQLHITGRKFMYLIVWLGTEFTIKKMKVDHSFWNNFMKAKLIFFFNEAMIKELANPRSARKMDLRKYNPETKTFI